MICALEALRLFCEILSWGQWADYSNWNKTCSVMNNVVFYAQHSGCSQLYSYILKEQKRHEGKSVAAVLLGHIKVVCTITYDYIIG